MRGMSFICHFLNTIITNSKENLIAREFIKNLLNHHKMSDTLDIKHELGRKAIHLTSLVIIFVFLYFGKD